MKILEDLKAFLSSAQKPLIAIIGPTASGKTNISINIAKALNGEIISTDSRQIYRHMPISTDVITEEEMQGVPHHMLEIREPDEILSLAEFKDLALEKIKEIQSRNAIPILVGGTGLYISAITANYDIPRVPADDKLRKELEYQAKEKGNEFVHNKLKELDPETAANIHPNNLRYVIRAIEINLNTGETKQDLQKESDFDVFLVGTSRPREEIYERVNQRVDEQVERGLIDEVKNLIDKGYDNSLPSMTSLGVKEIIPYIKGEMELEEALEILKRNTRRYAKRQMTWLRRYDNVHVVKPDDL